MSSSGIDIQLSLDAADLALLREMIVEFLGKVSFECSQEEIAIRMRFKIIIEKINQVIPPAGYMTKMYKAYEAQGISDDEFNNDFYELVKSGEWKNK